MPTVVWFFLRKKSARDTKRPKIVCSTNHRRGKFIKSQIEMNRFAINSHNYPRIVDRYNVYLLIRYHLLQYSAVFHRLNMNNGRSRLSKYWERLNKNRIKMEIRGNNNSMARLVDKFILSRVIPRESREIKWNPSAMNSFAATMSTRD